MRSGWGRRGCSQDKLPGGGVGHDGCGWGRAGVWRGCIAGLGVQVGQGIAERFQSRGGQQGGEGGRADEHDMQVGLHAALRRARRAGRRGDADQGAERGRAEGLGLVDGQQHAGLAVAAVAEAVHRLVGRIVGQQPGLHLAGLDQDALDRQRRAQGVADAHDPGAGAGGGQQGMGRIRPAVQDGGEPGQDRGSAAKRIEVGGLHWWGPPGRGGKVQHAAPRSNEGRSNEGGLNGPGCARRRRGRPGRPPNARAAPVRAGAAAPRCRYRCRGRR